MRIDAHHHFWNYQATAYPWIGVGMEILKRDFTPADLVPLLQTAQIDGVISVQARTNSAENEFLLDCAKKHSFIKGVVGYVDLTQPNAREQLERFALTDPKAVGIREVLQGLADDAYCLRQDFNEGLALLHDFGLVYDVLIFQRHLPNTIVMVDKHPLQTFVLDHIAKPMIQSATPDPTWVKNIQALAERENVYCKVSGMVTEVDPAKNWTPDLLKPYFEVVWNAFGAKRLMFGSDWPVCLLRSSYLQWVETVTAWTSTLSQDEQTAFWEKNPGEAYGLLG
jgi:L-fuconolactonase